MNIRLNYKFGQSGDLEKVSMHISILVCECFVCVCMLQCLRNDKNNEQPIWKLYTHAKCSLSNIWAIFKWAMSNVSVTDNKQYLSSVRQ